MSVLFFRDIRTIYNFNLVKQQSFQDAPFFLLKQVCNGCGSAKAKFDFVPDTIWGLNIAPACYIHDWDYYIGGDKKAKKQADKNFLINMKIIFRRAGSKWLVWPRIIRAYTYVTMVKLFGNSSFDFN